MTLDETAGQGVRFSFTDAHGATVEGDTVAGRLSWTVTSGGTFNSHTFLAGDQFVTFSTELIQCVSPGQDYEYVGTDPAEMTTIGQLGSPMGAFRAGLLQELFQHHYADATVGTTTEAAAFQVAIWEIVYEAAIDNGGVGSADAGAGAFVISQDLDAVTLANAWLSALEGNYEAGDMLMGLGSDSAQDQMMMLVPLPPPLLLAGVGLLGLAIGGRRLRKLALG